MTGGIPNGIGGLQDDGMDDAVHILYPGNTTLCLCGLKSRRIRIAITEPWPDSWSGCWTCLDEALKLVPPKAAA